MNCQHTNNNILCPVRPLFATQVPLNRNNTQQLFIKQCNADNNYRGPNITLNPQSTGKQIDPTIHYLMVQKPQKQSKHLMRNKFHIIFLSIKQMQY